MHRLWHQLTLAVQEFVSKPESGPLQVDLYNNFISDWEAKMSQQKLVSLGVSAAKQIRGKKGVVTLLSFAHGYSQINYGIHFPFILS